MKLFLVLISLSLFNFAHADTKATAKHITVELLTEGTQNVGIKFTMEPHWHVYWQNPGDSGEEPRITWKGIVTGPILWPQPEKIYVGPLADYGYSGEVLLISEVKNKKNSSTPINIEAEVKWLVCREICIPGKATLNTTLPNNTVPPPKFDATRVKIPQRLPADLQIETESIPNYFKIKIKSKNSFKTASFFPFKQLQIDNPAKQELNSNDLYIKKNEQLTTEPKTLEGLIQLDDKSYVVSSPVVLGQGSLPKSLVFMILFAFLGGILLNLMPCVFPVLSMKVFGFLKMVGRDKQKIRINALFYTLGILFSFWVLVGALLFLKAGGEKLGWGFQLQSPAFVGVLTSILFLFGLNLVGVYEISGSFMGWGNSLTRKEGHTGAFFTGVLATLVSTPCTAPFMGSAVGFALSQPNFITFLIFSALALGLAFPYVILAFNPSVGRFLPRPGPWMDILKQVTGFLIFATVIWLISVLSLETSPAFLIIILGSLFLISIAAWFLNRFPGKTWSHFVFVILVILSLTVAVVGPTGESQDLKWETFSQQLVEKYRGEGKNVFVDFTAAWCISCKVNELVVFSSDDVKRELTKHNVVLVKADWTNHDEKISEALTALGRSGVPTYAIYEGGKTNAPELLPEVITPGIVITALEKLK